MALKSASNTVKKLETLVNRFYLYISVSPAQPTLIDVYNINKYGFTIDHTRRTYEAETLEDAINDAYLSEILKKSP